MSILVRLVKLNIISLLLKVISHRLILAIDPYQELSKREELKSKILKFFLISISMIILLLKPSQRVYYGQVMKSISLKSSEFIFILSQLQLDLMQLLMVFQIMLLIEYMLIFQVIMQIHLHPQLSSTEKHPLKIKSQLLKRRNLKPLRAPNPPEKELEDNHQVVPIKKIKPILNNNLINLLHKRMEPVRKDNQKAMGIKVITNKKVLLMKSSMILLIRPLILV